jgi:hypothetical protein
MSHRDSSPFVLVVAALLQGSFAWHATAMPGSARVAWHYRGLAIALLRQPAVTFSTVVPPQSMADEKFEQAIALCESFASGMLPEHELESVPLMLDEVFTLDFAELRGRHFSAGSSWRTAVNVTCLQPAEGVDGGQLFNDELLAMPTRPGRACVGGHCSRACSRVQLRWLASETECAALVREAVELQPGTGPTGELEMHNLYLKLVAASGQVRTTLLFIRLLERMRRAIALEYGLPLHSLSPVTAFISRSVPNDDVTRRLVHVDESSWGAYHYSAVLYLCTSAEALAADGVRTAAADFSGGALHFVDSRRPVPRADSVLLPRRGLAAIFSSGWENVHVVAPVDTGVRHAIPAFFSTVPEAQPAPWDGHDGLPARGAAARAAALWRHGLMPQREEDFIAFMRHWARVFDAEQW